VDSALQVNDSARTDAPQLHLGTANEFFGVGAVNRDAPNRPSLSALVLAPLPRCIDTGCRQCRLGNAPLVGMDDLTEVVTLGRCGGLRELSSRFIAARVPWR